MKDRKVLFDRYCLPAMRAQTNKNFTWFVGFDPQTPSEYWNYFGDIGRPILASSRADFHNKVMESLSESEEKTVISRVDNDDALAINFTQIVQAMAGGIFAAGSALELPHVLHFRHGWEIDDKTGQVYSRQFPNSSFFSFLLDTCKETEIFDVHAGHHAHVSRYFPVTNVSLEKPMWLISVHGDNIGNKISGTAITAGPNELKDNFGVTKS